MELAGNSGFGRCSTQRGILADRHRQDGTCMQHTRMSLLVAEQEAQQTVVIWRTSACCTALLSNKDSRSVRRWIFGYIFGWRPDDGMTEWSGARCTYSLAPRHEIMRCFPLPPLLYPPPPSHLFDISRSRFLICTLTIMIALAIALLVAPLVSAQNRICYDRFSECTAGRY